MQEKILKMLAEQLVGHQGDVCLERLSELPKTAKRCAVKPLAFGETSGHRHIVEVADPTQLEFYEDANGVYFKVVEGTQVRHKVGESWTGEHHTIAIQPTETMPYIGVKIQRAEDPCTEVLDRVRD